MIRVTHIVLIACYCLFGVSSYAEELSFSRDVLPVLSDRCFHCHGPDDSTREADLRLDLEVHAKSDRGGYAAVAPGDLEGSELWRRVTSTEESELMPPPESHRKPLNEKQREAIRQWILSGAKWGKHWSFETTRRPEVPRGTAHPIDAFVRQRLAEEGHAPAPRAHLHSQFRRLSFALTGLSPSVDELEAFLFNPTDDAWQEAVEKMLTSPHHAERMAMWWLDAARYSDSDGFQHDETRQNWPWRDWVVQAFRDNMPFDQFTIEQFAGDLLPNATDEQILATCFHRNHMTNGEGGRDPEESRVDYVIDRVNTTGTVWLGLTLGCVQCHSHKFDPISQKDYYSMSAFFNSIDEDGKAGMSARPYLKYESPLVVEQINDLEEFISDCEQQHRGERQAAEQRFETWLEGILADPTRNYQAWWSTQPNVSSSDGTTFLVEENAVVQTTGPTPRHDDYRVEISIPKEMKRVSGWRVEIFPHDNHVQGRFTRQTDGEFVLTNVRALAKHANSPSEEQLEIASATADYEPDLKRNNRWHRRYANIKEVLNDDPRDGWTTAGAGSVQSHVGVFEFRAPWDVQEGDRLVIVLRHRSTEGNANIGRFRISLAQELGETVRRTDGQSPLASLLDDRPISVDKIPHELKQRLLDQFLLGDVAFQASYLQLQAAREQLETLEKQKEARSVMVLRDRKQPRKTHILVRGVWDSKGDEVSAGALSNIFERPVGEAPTRLDLARWIVDAENPLTARVTVNHLWQLVYGQGIVRTPEDFGLQGELPTHPKLLDWLAIELIENNWDLRHILRLIVTSETFRQSSQASAESLERDPENRLLARAPRFRLPAWMIHDNALRVSGLLNPLLGGPPMKPYQPDGVWGEITMGRFDYRPSLGPAQYRRTLYAFWRRSIAPTFLFDTAQRRVCEVGVRRTNTPLHALTLMNDTTMLEASRAMADQLVNAFPADDWNKQIERLALGVLSRPLSPSEVADVFSLWTEAAVQFERSPEQALAYTTVGQQDAPKAEQLTNTAAWMSVASMMLNLDEAISYE